MKKSLLFSIALLSAPVLTVGLTPAPAAADAKGDAILARIDKDASRFADQAYVATMKIHRGGAVKKTLVFEMTMKGLEKQYIVFKSPGDVAGMKVLMNGADELWMYNTEFKKVRRIAAHAQNQGFFGSHFTAEDMVLAKLSPAFNAAVSGKEGSKTTMTLTPKSGAKTSFSKLEVVIDSKVKAITLIRYFDGSGNLTRVQRREAWKKVSGLPLPTRITMEDTKSGNKTVIELSKVQVNQGITDDLFSRRTLLRG